MKRIIYFLVVVLVILCWSCNKSNINLTDKEIKVLKKDLRDYLNYCKSINKDPSFDFIPEQNYIEFLKYKGRFDSISKIIDNNEEEKIMLEKIVKLQMFKIDRCNYDETYADFRYNTPKINMLTNLNEFRYIAFLNDSIVNSEEFKRENVLIEVRDSLYYFRSK